MRRADAAAAREGAREAWRRGRAAFAAGALSEARDWFDRACRLAPAEGLFRYALAMASLAADPARAVALLEALGPDARAVRLALAEARARAGDEAGARAVLEATLRRFAMPAEGGWTRLADRLAPGGWCALGAGGRLVVGGGAREARAWLDGRLVRPGALPRCWRAGRWLDVREDDRRLFGAPIDLCAVTRLEGVAETDGARVFGTAWYPGEPERVPLLCLRDAACGRWRVRARAAARDPGAALFARPRRFTCRPGAVAWPVDVSDDNNQTLPGAPLHAPRPRPPARRPPRAVPARRPGVAIVIPVHGDAAATRACLASVLAARPRDVAVIVVDDGAPDAALRAHLDRLAARRRIRLLRHARALGFPAAANAGMRAAGRRDVLLLNADTRVAAEFLPRLRAAAYAAPDIASACPLSNNAAILSYPDKLGSGAMPDARATRALARLAWRANGASVVEIPTMVGFCVYLRRDFLDAAGDFDAALFARGYGEENDLAMRGRAGGWRHVAAPGVFVAHAGERSFAASAAAWRARGARLLARLWPDYDAAVRAHLRADPLASCRRALDLARLRAAGRGSEGAAILLTHAAGGGVEVAVTARCAALRAQGLRPLLLRPDGAGGVRLAEGTGAAYPNLTFRLPEAMDDLLRLLRALRPRLAEVHHWHGHHAAVLDLPARLGVPYAVFAHDYAAFCPRLTLGDAAGRYCGEPDRAGCLACVRANGAPARPGLSLDALRAAAGRLLAGAARVWAPSRDAAARLARHFPTLAPRLMPGDRVRPPKAVAPDPGAARRRVAVIGAIGPEKGLHVLRAVAAHAARADLPLEFILAGHSLDDAGLLATGRVFVTGAYAREELPGLLARHRPHLAFLPSLVPETWCHALSEAWQAGLPVLAFDLGAPAERIRARGGGWLLPLGLPPARIAEALLAARL